MEPYNLLVLTQIINTAIQYLAWPITLLIVLFILRKEIRGLLSRIKKGKFGAAELEFVSLVASAEAESQEITTEQVNVDEISSQAAEEAVLDPRGTILNAWIDVEKSIKNLLEVKGLSATRNGRNPRTGATIKIKSAIGGMRDINTLANAQIVSEKVISLLHDLRTMRNEAAHTHEFNPPTSAVLKYIGLSKTAKEALEDAIRS